MAESISTPRVNASTLDSFANQTVRILGKVTQLRGEEAQIDAGGVINCILTRECHLTVGNAVEVVGRVNQDLSVKVMISTDWGNNVDYNAANAVVDATHRYKEIFYGYN